MAGFKQAAGRALSAHEGYSDGGDLLLGGIRGVFDLFNQAKFFSERDRIIARTDKGTTLEGWWDVRIHDDGNFVTGEMPEITFLEFHVVARYIWPNDGRPEWHASNNYPPRVDLLIDNSPGHRQEWWQDTIKGTRVPTQVVVAGKQKKGVLKK